MPNIIKTGGGAVYQKVYLYNSGDECVGLTGGWEVYSGTYAGGTRTKEADNLYMLANVGSDTLAGFTNSTAINLTNYTKLYIDIDPVTYRAGGYNLVQIMSTKSSPSGHVGQVYCTTTGRQTLEIDVNSLNGSYFVLLRVDGKSTAHSGQRVYKVWLE